MKPSFLRQALLWLIAILVPFTLVLTSARLLATPAFLRLEYTSPGFPDDPYGFSLQDRLYWGGISLDYLLSSKDFSFIRDLKFPDGQPVYNQRELQHWIDVKNVVNTMLTFWYASLAVLLALGVFAWRGGWLDDYKMGLARGGWLTVFFIATAIVFVLFAFNGFFVFFHNIFFPPGTWVFEFSDTFIRLFPERFWRDLFLLVGVFSLAGALLLIFAFRRRRSPLKERSQAV